MDTNTQKPVSALFFFLLIMGACICAVAPPVGLLMIIAGIAQQRRVRGRRARRIKALAEAYRRERMVREEREILSAWRSF